MDYEPTIWQNGDTITSVRLNKLEQGVAVMGYEPTIWQDGDTITSVRLNKLEQGVATLSEGALGALQSPITSVGDRPEVGSNPTAGTIITIESVKLGSNYIIISSPEYPIKDAACAAGTTITLHDNELASSLPVAYVCALDGNGNYATVREIDLDETVDTENRTMTFVMPSLVLNEEEEYWEGLYIYYEVDN